MLILSHRGYHEEVPENTQEAFELALGLGVDGLETDVRLSADGLPILFHDRVVPDGREVASISRKELSRIMGYEVPTLEPVIKRWQDAFWNIEIKVPEALEATLSVVGQYAMTTKFLISSFWHPVVKEFCGTVNVDGGILIAHRPINLSCLLADLRTDSNLKAIIWDYEILDPDLLQLANLEGLSNFVYGALTKDEHRRLTALDIDGVITDRPQFLRGI